MALASRVPRQSTVLGHPKPRIAPPVPARHDLARFKETAEGAGITLMPWQENGLRYVTAKGPGEKPLYREVALVVARQQGKTTLAKPLILRWLRDGLRVLHVAQNRELPRHMFGLIAQELDESLFLKRRGKGGRMQTVWPRHGAGQEEILLQNGGSYRIAATTGMGPRGWSVDRVIVDELLAMTDHTAMMALEPTITMAPDGGQIVYMSNAGSDASVVLNAIRDRAGLDEGLAYLEWSAAPDRKPDDILGWEEANPALGHYPSVLSTLEAAYRKHKLANTLAIFETEHLCRWVTTTAERFLDDFAWAQCAAAELSPPVRSATAVSMAPEGTRASAAMAWQQPDGTVAVKLLYDVHGDPIDTDRLGRDIAKATGRSTGATGFDPLTDAELVKYVRRSKPLSGKPFANASAQFVNLVNANRIRFLDAEAVTNDLAWTVRQSSEERGTFQAVRAQGDRPIPAVLAAIRAVWLVSGPKLPTPKVM